MELMAPLVTFVDLNSSKDKCVGRLLESGE